jgi:hypothetical protein
MAQKNWPDRVYCLNPASLNATKVFGVTCRIQVKGSPATIETGRRYYDAAYSTQNETKYPNPDGFR